jgi:endonuclease/exonuclease/phosphatase (EEP) superfamily protein YafD
MVLRAATWLLVLCSCSTTRAVSRPEAGEPLSLMAYNVLGKGADDSRSLAAVAREGADVLCLTELTPRFVARFAAAFPADYPHRKFAPLAGALGVGVASRYPLTELKVYPIGPTRRPAMEVTVQRAGQRLQVICVHLMPPSVKVPTHGLGFEVRSWNEPIRRAEGADLLSHLRDKKRATVVVGDFNENTEGPAMQALLGVGFTAACAAPCGATFPGPALPWPSLFTIDHILGRGVAFTGARTVRDGGSDHYPVIARLRWLEVPPTAAGAR